MKNLEKRKTVKKKTTLVHSFIPQYPVTNNQNVL